MLFKDRDAVRLKALANGIEVSGEGIMITVRARRRKIVSLFRNIMGRQTLEALHCNFVAD